MSGEGTWACHVCTLENPANKRHCHACQSRRQRLVEEPPSSSNAHFFCNIMDSKETKTKKISTTYCFCKNHTQWRTMGAYCKLVFHDESDDIKTLLCSAQMKMKALNDVKVTEMISRRFTTARDCFRKCWKNLSARLKTRLLRSNKPTSRVKR